MRDNRGCSPWRTWWGRIVFAQCQQVTSSWCHDHVFPQDYVHALNRGSKISGTSAVSMNPATPNTIRTTRAKTGSVIALPSLSETVLILPSNALYYAIILSLARACACNAHRASNSPRNNQWATEIQRASETSQRVSQSQRASEHVNSGFWCILGTSTCSESFGELQRAAERCNRRHWKANRKLQLFKIILSSCKPFWKS